TAPSPSRWPRARPPASPSSTPSTPSRCSRTTTSCRARAPTCSSAWAARPRRAPSSSAPPRSRATPACASACWPAPPPVEGGASACGRRRLLDESVPRLAVLVPAVVRGRRQLEDAALRAGGLDRGDDLVDVANEEDVLDRARVRPDDREDTRVVLLHLVEDQL